MGKRYKMAIILLSVVMIVGCSSSQPKMERMDFQAAMELKVPEPAVGDRPKILFVGNSHTFYNNFSTMFVNIINAFGHKSKVSELSTAYYSLKKYADTEDRGGALLEQALSTQEWDFVVLQESTNLTLADFAEEEMFPSTRILDEKIKACGGQTIFFMTWAPKDGIKKEKREDIQTQMATSYISIANELDGLLIPAGISFMRCAELYPEIELWDPDGHHPSLAGSYLAACTAYAVLYQESPEHCSYIADLDKEHALKLQQIAAELVLN